MRSSGDRVRTSGNSMARILVTPASNVLAHAGRSVLLGRELKRRGHEVAFAGTDRFLEDPRVVQPGEFERFPLDDVTVEMGMAVLRKLRPRMKRGFLEAHVEQELSLLDAFQPDVVVNDFRLTMYVSAKVRAVPVVSLMGGKYLYQYARDPFLAPRTHWLYPLLRPVLGEERLRRLLEPFYLRVQRYKMDAHTRLMKERTGETRANLWELLEADLNLILDTEWCAPTRDLPPSFHRVGPLRWTPDMELPEWAAGLDRSRPVVFVTMGSTGDPRLFTGIVELFADTETTLVVATGGQVDLSQNGLPANVHAARFLPGEPMMALADVVIFHGGAGSGYQVFGSGRPSVAIATHIEQEFMGHVLEREHAGVFLTMREALRNPGRVRAAVDHILSNRAEFEYNARRLQADMLRHDPLGDAADRVEDFLRKRT